MDYGIAQLSMAMSSFSVQQQASVSVLKNTMDASEQIAMKLIESLADLPVGNAPAGIDVLV